MHDVVLWVAFSSKSLATEFLGLLKPLYSNWHLISIGPQVVCKVFHDKNSVRERSFHLMQKNAKYFRRGHLLYPLLLTGHILDLYKY